MEWCNTTYQNIKSDHRFGSNVCTHAMGVYNSYDANHLKIHIYILKGKTNLTDSIFDLAKSVEILIEKLYAKPASAGSNVQHSTSFTQLTKWY